MKRMLFICLFVVLTIVVTGQTRERRVFFSTTLGTGIAVNTPFTWQITGYYLLSPRWQAGVGTGISVYEKTIVPLFAELKYMLAGTRPLVPFAGCGAGYSFALDSETNGGGYLVPSIGVHYRMGARYKLLFAVGYEVQKLERVKSYRDSRFISEYREKLCHGSVAIKLGIVF